MTIGIYSLYWEEQDLIYIGQSQNIERRFSEHTRKMKTQVHFNYKVQNAYNLYGLPEFSIIETCSTKDLNTLEIFWVEEFNSIDNGLNINEPGTQGGSGVHHPSAKYSKIKYLRIFSRLYKGQLSIADIATIEQVPRSIVSHICSSSSHQWIREAYPEKFELMKIRALNRKVVNPHGGRKTYFEQQGHPLQLIHEDGSIISLYNITQDCKKYSLHPSAILALIKGTRLSHKQYRIKH